MSVAFYRKYRSKKLSEIVGQDHITKILDLAIKNNKIAHAYLFSGPRGVGKTSIARILAYEIIKEPYNEKNTLGRIVKGVLKSFSPLEFIDKNLTFNELKDFKETISDYKIVDLEKLDEIAEEIYKNYIEFEIIPLEVNDLDELF